ncbi:MAG: hypothetical protein KF785_10880 [Gemmatimonadales bacterium]|nr:hypothetical protein [Gemmatimonadales bacterium]
MQHERNHDRERWPDLKDRILKRWSNLAEKELDATEGDWDRIRTLIAAEYGISGEKAEQEMDALLTGNAAYSAAPTSTRSPADRAGRAPQLDDEAVRRRMGGPVHRTN